MKGNNTGATRMSLFLDIFSKKTNNGPKHGLLSNRRMCQVGFTRYHCSPRDKTRNFLGFHWHDTLLPEPAMLYCPSIFLWLSHFLCYRPVLSQGILENL